MPDLVAVSKGWVLAEGGVGGVQFACELLEGSGCEQACGYCDGKGEPTSDVRERSQAEDDVGECTCAPMPTLELIGTRLKAIYFRENRVEATGAAWKLLEDHAPKELSRFHTNFTTGRNRQRTSTYVARVQFWASVHSQ